ARSSRERTHARLARDLRPALGRESRCGLVAHVHDLDPLRAAAVVDGEQVSTREREQLAHAVRLQAPGDEPPAVKGLRVLLGVTRGRHRRRLYLLGTRACAQIARRTALRAPADARSGAARSN